MNKKYTNKAKHIDFVLLDLVALQLSFVVSYLIRLGTDNYMVPGDYVLLDAVVVLMHFFLVLFNESYSGIMRRGKLKELKSVLIHNIELLGLILVYLFFVKQSANYSRIIFALFISFNVIIMWILRSIRKYILLTKKVTERNKSRMLVVTSSKNVNELMSKLTKHNYYNYNVHGVVLLDKTVTDEKIEEVPLVADADSMYDFVKSNVIDEVFLDYIGEDMDEMVDKFITIGVKVHVNINAIVSSDFPNAHIDKVNEFSVMTMSISHVSLYEKIVKRLIDIFVAIPGLIMMGISFIFVAPIIYIQSPGPIFFKQNRVGKNGRVFKIYKFRSMYMDAEERKKELMEKNKMSGLMFKMDDDPRITPIGKFIRKTSIDELPQFINIFKGDMSLVGTRPPTVDEYNEYEHHHKSRLAMKPGLTGMWQVSGRSDITDFEEVVRLDNEYIRNYSLGLDIKIICKTFGVVLGRKGSS